MKTKIAVALAVIASIGGYVAAGPWITLHSLRAAAQDRDVEALAENVDFPALRQSVKAQVNSLMAASLAQDGAGALGSAFAGPFVDQIVDAMVSPEGLKQMMALEAQAGAERPAGEGPDPFANASTSYESLERFVVTVKNEAGKNNQFVLRRSGLSWKLAEIVIPTPAP